MTQQVTATNTSTLIAIVTDTWKQFIQKAYQSRIDIVWPAVRVSWLENHG